MGNLSQIYMNHNTSIQVHPLPALGPPRESVEDGLDWVRFPPLSQGAEMTGHVAEKAASSRWVICSRKGSLTEVDENWGGTFSGSPWGKAESLPLKNAGVAQWQSPGFPSRSRGFDPRRPLHTCGGGANQAHPSIRWGIRADSPASCSKSAGLAEQADAQDSESCGTAISVQVRYPAPNKNRNERKKEKSNE